MVRKPTQGDSSVELLQEQIESKIYLIRGKRVMLDRDLAALYGVVTGHLNRAVKRNIERFPNDFMFKLSKVEFESLRCQIGISKYGKGGDRYLPYVFTQEGVVMLSSVLNSSRAIQVNIQIMRIFVRLREFMLSHRELAQKIEHLENKFQQHDKDIILIFKAIKDLLSKPQEAQPKKKFIGFHVK